MNDFSIWSEQHSCMWIGRVTFNKLLVSLLNSKCIKYDSTILFALYIDTSVHIQIEAMTVVSSVINIYYYLLYDTTMLRT
jgi:hypothetical protein